MKAEAIRLCEIPLARSRAQRSTVRLQTIPDDPVGLNTYRWLQSKPMSYSSDPQLLESAWTRAVSQYPKNTEILRSVGFRGKFDRPFWTNDSNAPTTEEGRARIIRAAIDKQIEIVRNRYPQADFVMNAWGEMQDFLVEDRLISPVEDHLTGSLAGPTTISLTLPSSCWQVCVL